MSQSTIKDLSKILSKILGEEISLEPEHTAEDIEGWDSLNNIRITLEIEKVFNISMAAVEMSNLKNISDLIDFIELKK
jgi:acyl carrier protein